jgi:hypothetical protein
LALSGGKQIEQPAPFSVRPEATIDFGVDLASVFNRGLDVGFVDYCTGSVTVRP